MGEPQNNPEYHPTILAKKNTMQLNELLLAGFVGKDAAEHTTKSGTRIVSFNLCHTNKGKNGGKDISTWVRVKVFGQWCETAIQIKKGDNVFVKGPISLSEYEKDGVKHSMIEMIANSIAVIKKVERQAEAVQDVDDFADIPF